MSKIDYFTSVLKDYDVREELKKKPVKAHIYCGRHNAQCLHVFSEEVADLIPNGSLTTFEYSNHSPAIEEEEKFKTFPKSTISRACSSLIYQYKRSYYLEKHNHKRIEYRRRISQRLSHNATVENTFG